MFLFGNTTKYYVNKPRRQNISIMLTKISNDVSHLSLLILYNYLTIERYRYELLARFLGLRNMIPDNTGVTAGYWEVVKTRNATVTEWHVLRPPVKNEDVDEKGFLIRKGSLSRSTSADRKGPTQSSTLPRPLKQGKKSGSSKSLEKY